MSNELSNLGIEQVVRSRRGAGSTSPGISWTSRREVMEPSFTKATDRRSSKSAGRVVGAFTLSQPWPRDDARTGSRLVFVGDCRWVCRMVGLPDQTGVQVASWSRRGVRGKADRLVTLQAAVREFCCAPTAAGRTMTFHQLGLQARRVPWCSPGSWRIASMTATPNAAMNLANLTPGI